MNIYNVPIINLNKYNMVKELGRGAFGAVYEGVDKETGVKKAVKVMHNMSDQTIRDTIQEVNMLKNISTSPQCHPGIVCYEGFYYDPTKNQYVLIMQLIEGTDLEKFLQTNTLINLEDLKKMMVHLFSALEFLHSKNVAHRDIKPANIMIHKNGLYLVDLGLSCYTDKNKNPPCNRFGGTPYFFPPEYFTKDVSKDSSKAHDVWSLAMTFYLAVNKYSPYGPGLFGDALFTKNSEGKFRDNKQEIIWVVRKCGLGVKDTENLGDIINICLDQDPLTRPRASYIVQRLKLGQDYMEEDYPLPKNITNNYNVYYDYSNDMIKLIYTFDSLSKFNLVKLSIKIVNVKFQYNNNNNRYNSLAIGKFIIKIDQAKYLNTSSIYLMNDIYPVVVDENKDLVLLNL